MNHDWCAVVLSILSEQTRGVNELIRLTNKNSCLVGSHGAKVTEHSQCRILT
jgi:hypothetical protein